MFLFPIAIGFGILELGMRSVPNDYAYKNQWLEKNISSTKIWILGSSHSLLGVNPQCLSLSAFNSAHVSQTLPYDAFIVSKYIHQADSLEWVILPMSYFSLTYSLEDSEEWWRIKNYCIYYAYPYCSWNPNYHFEIFGNPLSYREQLERIAKYWKNGVDSRDSDSLGFSHRYSKDKRDSNWCRDGQERAIYHTKNLNDCESIIQEHVTSLERIINLSLEKNARVLLFTPPVSRAYYESIEPKQYDLIVKTCKDMENRYPHVTYLNLFMDSRFVDDDFFDSDHLETKGASKLSKILDDYITKNSEQ